MLNFFKKVINRFKRKNKINNSAYNKEGLRIADFVDLNNVELDRFVNIAHHAQVSNSSIGLRTSIGRYAKIQYADIGKYCLISWDVTIGAIGHPLHSVSMHAFSYRKFFGLCEQDIYLNHERVKIFNDVWIGCHAIIMPGVKIHNGAVIGAGSVVTHDVNEYEIVAGVPARHLSWRFSTEEKRKFFSELDWWNWPDDFIREHIALFEPDNDYENDDTAFAKLINLKEAAKFHEQII